MAVRKSRGYAHVDDGRKKQIDPLAGINTRKKKKLKISDLDKNLDDYFERMRKK